MRPIIVCHSDHQGGAARAAWRLHRALVDSGVDSLMRVGNCASGDWRVTGPVGKIGQGLARVRPTIDGLAMKLQGSENPVLHSPAWISGISNSEINSGSWDVVNLHWTCAGYLSIEQLAGIRKPIVWTLHDMWAFCGAEHYDTDAHDARWRTGYRKDNRPSGHRGLDVDLWTWRRKLRAWTDVGLSIVCPSRWLADCVSQSALLGGKHVAVVPNALDVDVFKPVEKALARRVLNLPPDAEIVLFGALGGSSDPRKGWDLLAPALELLSRRRSRAVGVVFGGREPRDPPRLGLPMKWFGHIGDDYTLTLLYSAADVMVVPSRQENLPQSATEAQACGCPVVAFNTCGMPDAVLHAQTGYLANSIDSEALCNGIAWVLDDQERRDHLSKEAYVRARKLWSQDVIAKQYVEEFRRASS